MGKSDVSPCVSTFNNFKYFIIILKKIKISCFHDWMVLNYDMWCNKTLSRGILIEFVQNKFKSIFKYVGQTR